MPVTKPHLVDDWEPTNKSLWERVESLAKGESQSLRVKDATYYAPRDGQGFKQWPSPNATGWCVRIYNLAGGRWRKRGEHKEIRLTGELKERVAERHSLKLARALGPDLRRHLSHYQDSPNCDWKSCTNCSFWAAHTLGTVKQGTCLRHSFDTVALGYCPKFSSIG